MSTRKGVGLPTMWNGKQLDHIMFRIRQELNVTDTWLKLKGAGKRFDYEIECECGSMRTAYGYAALAIAQSHQLLGHRVDVKTSERDRSDEEKRNGAYPDKRRGNARHAYSYYCGICRRQRDVTEDDPTGPVSVPCPECGGRLTRLAA